MERSSTQNENVIMYGTPTCPMVPPVRGMLERAQVMLDYVNIAEDAEGRGKVMAINDGNWVFVLFGLGLMSFAVVSSRQ